MAKNNAAPRSAWSTDEFLAEIVAKVQLSYIFRPSLARFCDFLKFFCYHKNLTFRGQGLTTSIKTSVVNIVFVIEGF